MRVRPILIPGDDSKPGFRFLLSRCTLAGGRARGAAPFPLHHPTHRHRLISRSSLPFGRAGTAPGAPAPLLLSGLVARSSPVSRRHLRARPRGPGHAAAAAAGTRVSTPKREVSALRLAACHARLQAATLEPRVPGTGHSFPSTSRQGQPRAAASLAPGAPLARPRQAGRGPRAARDGDVRSSFPVFHSCGLEKCVHETSCCGIMSWAFGRALFSAADELN